MNIYIFLMMGFFPFLAIVVGYAVFNRTPKNGPTQNRGTEPSQNSSLVTGGIASGRGGHYSAITIPRDPQEYAKAMMPSHAKKKENK